MLDRFELVSKASADRNRIRILKLLKGGELCVCQLVAVLELSNATVSKHLSVLRGAGLVTVRREGRWAHYGLAADRGDPCAAGVLALVGGMLDDDPTVIADRARLGAVAATPLDALCA